MNDKQNRRYLDDVPQEVQDLIYAGQKIAAIKLVREKKGCDLKEAKDRVDAVQARLREQFPEDFAAGTGKAGCASVLLALPLLAAVLWLIYRVQ